VGEWRITETPRYFSVRPLGNSPSLLISLCETEMTAVADRIERRSPNR